MIYPASSDCLQRAGWGAATLKLAGFIWRNNVAALFLQMWSKKTHEFPADFPFNILSIFLPYGCQCSSVRVCGLSRPSVRAIFPAGDDGAVGVPFAKSCFSRLFVTGRRVWSPCTPLLSRTCPRSFVGLVVLRRCCRLSGRPLYSWGLAAHTSWLFFQHTDACVMCDVWERERVSIFLQEILHGPGGSFEWPPQVALWERLPLKELEAECYRCRGPETLPWLITYTIGDSTWLKDHLWVDLWFSPSFLEGGGLMIRHVRFDNWWVVELFFLGVTYAIRDYGLTLGTPINQLPSRHPCEKRWTLEQLPPLFGSSNNLKCLLLPPWHEIH